MSIWLFNNNSSYCIMKRIFQIYQSTCHFDFYFLYIKYSPKIKIITVIKKICLILGILSWNISKNFLELLVFHFYFSIFWSDESYLIVMYEWSKEQFKAWQGKRISWTNLLNIILKHFERFFIIWNIINYSGLSQKN